MDPSDEARLDRDESLGATLYAELRRIAESRLRSERGDHTLRATDLVHEAWLRIRAQIEPGQLPPAQFKALAATMMRRVLIDHARARRALKRGLGHDRVVLDTSDGDFPRMTTPDVIEIHDSLERLDALSPLQARIAELRLFGELTLGEIAVALGGRLRSIEREWALARAWLRNEWS